MSGQPSKEELRKLQHLASRQKLPLDISLADYCQATLNFPLHDWQREYLCPILEKAITEPGARIILHAAPQWGKSILNQRKIAWAIRRDPKLRTAMMCYNITHATGFGQVIRALLVGEGIIEAHSSSKAFSTRERELENDGQPSFMALGLLSGLIGKGPDCLDIDDPFGSVEDAFSPTINDKADRIFRTTVANRISPDASITITCHRYHDDDFIARRLGDLGIEGEKVWTYIRFPVISDDDPDNTDPTGRPPGVLLSPRQNLSEAKTWVFLNQRKDADPITFESQFQGNPKPFEGALFKRSDFRIVPIEEFPRLEMWVSSWDLAASDKKTSDDSARALMGSDEYGNVWIRDVRVTHTQWGETQDFIADTTEEDIAAGLNLTVGIETFGFQIAAIQDLFRHAMSHKVPFMPLTPKGNKRQKALVWAGRARCGKVILARGAWNEKFVAQCVAFTGRDGGKDDMVDAVSNGMALLYQVGSKEEEDEKKTYAQTYTVQDVISSMRENHRRDTAADFDAYRGDYDGFD